MSGRAPLRSSSGVSPDPSAPPVVVIHGGPSWDHSYLRPALSMLNAVLFDLRGCGRSERGLDVQPEFLADFDSEQAWLITVSAFLIEPLASADADRGA